MRYFGNLVSVDLLNGVNGVVEFSDSLLALVTDGAISGYQHTPHRVEISPYCVAKLTGRDAAANYLRVNGARVDIHTAAYLGDYKSVFRLLDADPSLLNQGHSQHDMGRGDERHLGFYTASVAWATPVCYAIVGGHMEIVANFTWGDDKALQQTTAWVCRWGKPHRYCAVLTRKWC